MSELVKNNHFVAHEVGQADGKVIISIESATQKDEAIRNAREVVESMIDIQRAILKTASGANISLIIDVCYLTSLVGTAGRLPEFGELNRLATQFDAIINYSSQKTVAMSVVMQLIKLLSWRAPNVRTAPNYDEALKMARDH